jgi:hypothetical protein
MSKRFAPSAAASLPCADLDQIQYATDLFYIIILYLSRASIICLLERLQGLGLKPIWKYSLAVLSLWFVASVFAVSLKCDLSQPWIEYNAQCSGLVCTFCSRCASLTVAASTVAGN